jgi:hypothetical protein
VVHDEAMPPRLVSWVAFLACLVPCVAAAQEPSAQPLRIIMPPAAANPVLLQQEMEAVQTRLVELDAQRGRLGIGMPIALTAGGLVIGAATGFMAFFVWFIDGAAHGFDDGLSGDQQKAVRTLGLISLGGVALGAGGLTWLTRRLRARGEVRRERKVLDERQRQLEVRLMQTSSLQGAGLSMRLSF